MKIRTDSLFAKLTEDDREMLVNMSYNTTLDQMVRRVAEFPKPIHCSIPAMSRFLKKAREEKLLREAEASQETVEAFARRGGDTKVRDGALAAIRDRMFDVAVDSNNRELLMEVFRGLNDERSKERMLELEERKVKVAEENARLGWRKMEIENARSGVKLLPKLRELVGDATKPAEERLALVRQCLEIEGARLLPGIPDSISEPERTPQLERATSPQKMELKPLPAREPEPESGRPVSAQPFVRDAKVGRNEACPCGSGLKYKRCCEGKQAVPMREAA